ncbi:cell wall hydrolase [Ancylobacter sp. G4_0304]|uniref:cell wall hydrolase n=1 Tax=Ancylobacter sp. G4_0304 TaxID=3114289 RepID=UPI0039C6AA76
MGAVTRYRRLGLWAGLLVAWTLGASTSIGRQDIAGLLAHQPGIAERARLSVYSGAFHTLKAATFAWPSTHSPLLGTSIDAPPRIGGTLNDVNRSPKADRLEAREEQTIEPEDRAGQQTPETVAGAGTSTSGDPTFGRGTAMAAGSATGTGISTADAGIGTDPHEADDVADDATDTADRTALALGGVDSISAGDPTGDPTELEADAITLGPDESGDRIDPGEAGARETPAVSFSPSTPIYRESALIFSLDREALPPQPFLHAVAPLPDSGTTLAEKSDEPDTRVRSGPSPAERLGLAGKRLERSLKCLAEAVYFESRGEPERGQVAVAQVVMNRVFSGYYPADICRAVYQNAHRKLACQFTFACDNIKDVVTEPKLWQQARRIADDMLDGRIWDEKVGRATHYHARSVRPNWISEMRKLDRIGEHTFYRPRRWTS